MKILALGGSGGMGRFAVKSLLNFPIGWEKQPISIIKSL